jgi:hypothetical protein
MQWGKWTTIVTKVFLSPVLLLDEIKCLYLRDLCTEEAALREELKAIVAEKGQVQKEEEAINEQMRILQS